MAQKDKGILRPATRLTFLVAVLRENEIPFSNEDNAVGEISDFKTYERPYGS